MSTRGEKESATAFRHGVVVGEKIHSFLSLSFAYRGAEGLLTLATSRLGWSHIAWSQNRPAGA